LLNLLVAFPYFDKAIIKELETLKGRYRLIVDSGAFTAWNAGKPVHLDDYCEFLDSIEHLKPFNAVQLDVIGDGEATYKNLLEMQNRGYDVMPVFTRGEDPQRLEEFYKMHDYVMLGGLVGGKTNKNYVKWFLNRNKSRDIHLLGFTNIDFVKHYKPKSVDSSSWVGAARFGAISLQTRGGKVKTVHKTKFIERPENWIIDHIKELGFSFSEIARLRKAEAWINSGFFDDSKGSIKTFAQFVSTCSHVKRAIDIEREVGTHIYLAASHVWQIRDIYKAYELMLERGVIEDPKK